MTVGVKTAPEPGGEAGITEPVPSSAVTSTVRVPHLT